MHSQLAEQVAVHHVRVCTVFDCPALLGGFSLQNCCMEELPAVLGAASRLRQLRISDLHGGPISLEPDDLETLSSMSSLTFLSFAQASPHRDSRVFKGLHHIYHIVLLGLGSAGIGKHDGGSGCMHQLLRRIGVE